ncbi:MAG: hypothetical protein PF436_04875 [Prolixibacteraceae bacterium]|jgi:hypothetical protein|nr:hypothetical protein [Prolixibacteraceae bacterium]
MSFKRLIVSVLLLVVMAGILSSCKRNLSSHKAEKHLRAFDHEMITMFNDISSSEAYRILSKAVGCRCMPLPFGYSAGDEDGVLGFDFEAKKGVYRYEETMHRVERIADSDSLIIQIPLKGGNDDVAEIVLSEYSEKLTAWGFYYPLIMELSIEQDGRKLMIIQGSGSVEHGVPVYGAWKINIGRYAFDMGLKTRLSRRKGKSEIVMNVLRSNEVYMSGSVNMTNRINNGSLNVEKMAFDINTMPLTVSGNVKYGKIDAATTNFINSFNKNSSIEIYTGNGYSVGKMRLMPRENNTRLNFAIVYPDGNTAFTDDFLFTMRTFMNIKL